MSLFYNVIEICGSALQIKYLERIDRLFRRAHRYGYTTKIIKMSCLIEDRDRILFEKIINDPEQVLYELFPPKRLRVLRKRDHAFILPNVKTERYKR